MKEKIRKLIFGRYKLDTRQIIQLRKFLIEFKNAENPDIDYAQVKITEIVNENK